MDAPESLDDNEVVEDADAEHGDAGLCGGYKNSHVKPGKPRQKYLHIIICLLITYVL